MLGGHDGREEDCIGAKIELTSRHAESGRLGRLVRRSRRYRAALYRQKLHLGAFVLSRRGCMAGRTRGTAPKLHP